MAKSLQTIIKLLAALIGIMVVVHAVNVTLGGQLNQYGIIPRSSEHWFHVFTAPFLHADFAHLMNNLFGLTIFSALCLFRSVSLYVVCSLFIIATTGAMVWFFARDAIHIGASGWVFGLWSFSIAIACFDRSIINIILSIVVVFLYGGMIFGVLPSDPKVSFEAHLFGALSGVLFAFLYSVQIKRANADADASSDRSALK